MSAFRRLSPLRIAAGLLLLSLLAGAGLCASVLLVGLRLAAPANTIVGPPPADLPGVEAVQIPSLSGSRLQGWWVPGRQPGGGAMILMHGVWSDRRTMVQRARVLHEHGFAVLPLLSQHLQRDLADGPDPSPPGTP